MIFHRQTPFMLSLVIAVLLLLGTFIAPVSAHPHVFIDYGITFVFDEQGLTGIAVDWAFDEMFSQMLLEDGDLNKNRHFDAREIAAIKSGAFDNLANYGYFTHILVNGKPFPVTEPTGFQAVLQENRAHYLFFIPCRVAGGRTPQKVCLTLYDATHYTDLSLAPEGIGYRGTNGRFDLHYEETLAQEVGFTQAPLLPDGILLEFRNK
jgi:ABC-type uncharacterized transport system substrate-binding protein